MGTAIAKTTPVGREPQRIGTALEWTGQLQMSASYATGGDTISAKTLGMNAISNGIIGTANGRTFELVAQTDPSTAKIKAYTASGTEVANATDVSALQPHSRIRGR